MESIDHNFIISNRAQLLRYITLEIADESLTAKLNSLDEEELTAIIVTEAEQLITKMRDAKILIDEIQLVYFNNKKPFRREYGLMLFPFLTYFVNTAEMLEIDSRSLLKKKKLSFILNAIDPITRKKLNDLITESDQQFRNQIDSVKHNASERFVWMFSNLLQKINQIHVDQHESEALKALLLAFSSAAQPFFDLTEGSSEEDLLEDMGNYLSQSALEAFPSKETIIHHLKKAGFRHYTDQLAETFDQEREIFQDKMTFETKAIYEQFCLQTEQAWDDYFKRFNQRLTRLEDYFNNLK